MKVRSEQNRDTMTGLGVFFLPGLVVKSMYIAQTHKLFLTE